MLQPPNDRFRAMLAGSESVLVGPPGPGQNRANLPMLNVNCLYLDMFVSCYLRHNWHDQQLNYEHELGLAMWSNWDI